MKTPLLPLLLTYVATILQRWRFRTRDALERWQERRIQAHLHFLKARSPFYKKLFEDQQSLSWDSLPIMNKAQMMEHLDTLNTLGLKKDQLMRFALDCERDRDFDRELGAVTVGLSSGTSGNRGLFIASVHERARWAGYVLARLLPAGLWKRQRIALFLRAGGPLYESTQSAQIRFRYFDIFRDLEKYFAELQSWQPTVLVGPPSVLLLLAQAKKSGQLHIEPARVIAVAEVLDDHDRIALEEVFGGPIHQLYQATEGCLASTCAYGTLHMHEDVVRVEKEWIDEEQGRFVPIITDFQRKTQPIVRYRLDDVLVERRRPCPCGSVFTALDRIEGRCDELLWLPAVNGQGLRHIFPDFVRRALLGSSVLLREYRLRQLSPHSIRLELDCLPEHRAAVALGARAALNALFRRQGLIEAEIEVAPWSPEAPGAKSRRIQGLRRN